MQSNAAYLIEWETWTWTKIADMNYPRTWHDCASIRGTVYVFSFRHNENDPFIPYEKYDAVKDRWILGKILEMQPLLVNTKIVSYGNVAVMMVYEPPTTRVYKFDTEYEDWVKTSDLPKRLITETDTVGRKRPLPTPKMNRNRKFSVLLSLLTGLPKNGDFKSKRVLWLQNSIIKKMQAGKVRLYCDKNNFKRGKFHFWLRKLGLTRLKTATFCSLPKKFSVPITDTDTDTEYSAEHSAEKVFGRPLVKTDFIFHRGRHSIAYIALPCQ